MERNDVGETRACSWSRMLSFVIISRVLSVSLCLTHTHKQVCGGSGIPAGKCNCAGDVTDACGTCGGDGSSCAGCDGVANSGKAVDLCGVCDGAGIAAGTCNCDGDVLDQCGVYTKSADVSVKRATHASVNVHICGSKQIGFHLGPYTMMVSCVSGSQISLMRCVDP